MTDLHPDVVLTDRSGFTFWHEDVLRFGDLDRQNHVNNVAFASFCESGRVLFIDTVARPLLETDDLFALVKITIDYHHEVSFPGTIEIGTRLTRLGRSSVDFGQGLFNQGRCVATSHAVVVLMDAVTRKSKPFPDRLAGEIRKLISAAGMDG